MNTQKLLTFSAIVVTLLLMFFLRLQASDPCAPPDCCPPKKLVSDVLTNDYSMIKKKVYMLEICDQTNQSGWGIQGNIGTGGGGVGGNYGNSTSTRFCWILIDENSIEIGQEKEPPDKPPKGKWSGPLIRNKSNKVIPGKSCKVRRCKRTDKIEKVHNWSRSYQYCE